MPSDLSPSEKEDKEVGRLIDKKPAPSRKNRPKRGPKQDNRRRRMKVDDPDLSSKDKDLSMNHKGYSTSLCDVALSIFESASNDSLSFKDMLKTAQSHGLTEQGHPSGKTNTGYNSIDKRYIDKSHYKMILKSAKELLSEPYFKDGWDKGDSRFRAALDVAIYSSNASQFQSKIDTEMYNRILSELIGSGENLFVDTFIGKKRTRESSVMNDSNIKALYQIASDIRHSHPDKSLSMIKSISALKVANWGSESGQVSAEKDDEPEFAKKSNLIEIRSLIEKASKSKTSEELAKNMEALLKITKTAGSRIAEDTFDISIIEDMTDEDIKNVLLPALEAHYKTMDDLIEEAVKGIDGPDEITELDIPKFIGALDAAFEAIQTTVESDKTGRTSSVKISLNTLARLVAASDQNKEILASAIVAAKKKITKKKMSKKKMSKKDLKNKKTKKRASISSGDMNW